MTGDHSKVAKFRWTMAPLTTKRRGNSGQSVDTNDAATRSRRSLVHKTLAICEPTHSAANFFDPSLTEWITLLAKRTLATM
jgi:hypothetical protein